MSTPTLGPIGALTATFSSDPVVIAAIEQSAPTIMKDVVFLIFLFFHWLFLEEKHFGLIGERDIAMKGVWFFAIISVLLATIIWFAREKSPMIAFWGGNWFDHIFHCSWFSPECRSR
ncbi:MAG: hypothetical protein WCF90_00205 [Methanomicrobiales archaeon]